MLSSCFSLGWSIYDPNLKPDSDDPHFLTYVDATLAPSYWGLFMTVLLSMHQLGVTLQVSLGEINKKQMRTRQRLALVAVLAVLVALLITMVMFRN